MTGDPRPRPADGGPQHAALFESFPDPLLAYASGIESDESDGTSDDGGSDARSGALVVRRINPAFEATFDVAVDEVTGTPLDEVVLAGTVAPDRDADGTNANTDTTDTTDRSDATDGSATATAGSVLERVREAGAPVRFEHGTDGGTRHFRVRAVTAGGAAEAGCLLFTDVTELERQRRDLAGTVARLERLASVASHDLRNPLEVAEIRLEAARDTGEDVHFEKVAGALDRIEHIVRDVLAVGGGGVDPTDTAALEEVARDAWETVDTADATLVVSGELPTVRGDTDRLRGLFENLFRNSVEHGGRDVTVTAEPLPDGFAVTDDGPGVPETVGERVFEVGYSTRENGSGLGLSIVRQVAREHGWRVSLASVRESTADDGGARFEFTGVERIESGTDSSEPDDSGFPGGSN